MSVAVELSTCGDASTELYSIAEEVRCLGLESPILRLRSDCATQCISLCKPILDAQVTPLS